MPTFVAPPLQRKRKRPFKIPQNAPFASHEDREMVLSSNILQSRNELRPACPLGALAARSHHRPIFLKSLLHPCRDRPEAIVHLAGRLSENQTDDRLARDAGVFEAAKDVDLGVGEYDARARGILDGVLGLAVFACDAADGAG